MTGLLPCNKDSCEKVVLSDAAGVQELGLYADRFRTRRLMHGLLFGVRALQTKSACTNGQTVPPDFRLSVRLEDLMDKLSLADIRNKNRSDIYSLIYKEGRTAKSKIASSLELSLPTVTQHLADLTTEGLIEQDGQITSGIGRRAAAYAIRPSVRFAVGLEVLADRITIVVTDLYTRIMTREAIRKQFVNNDNYFMELSRIVRDVLAGGGHREKDLLGIGVGIQGLVSPDGERVTYGRILDCTGAEIRPMAERFSSPVRFMHDSECAADIELSKDSSITNALYVSLSANLGCALILDGRISPGRTGRAGTIEHLTLDPDGPLCYCGKRGCLECYCSVNALLKPGEQLPDFMDAVHSGSEEESARWEAYLDHLASALKDVHMVLDCEVILGGHMAPYLTEDDLGKLFEKIKERSPFPEDENFLRTGIQKRDAISTGAALPFIRHFLESV